MSLDVRINYFGGQASLYMTITDGKSLFSFVFLVGKIFHKDNAILEVCSHPVLDQHLGLG